jgi:hypothetical protein
VTETHTQHQPSKTGQSLTCGSREDIGRYALPGHKGEILDALPGTAQLPKQPDSMLLLLLLLLSQQVMPASSPSVSHTTQPQHSTRRPVCRRGHHTNSWPGSVPNPHNAQGSSRALRHSNVPDPAP